MTVRRRRSAAIRFLLQQCGFPRNCIFPNIDHLPGDDAMARMEPRLLIPPEASAKPFLAFFDEIKRPWKQTAGPTQRFITGPKSAWMRRSKKIFRRS
jgi:hypothetical protein